MKNVLVIMPLQEEDQALLVSKAGGEGKAYSFTFRSSGDEVSAEELAAADILVGAIPPERLCQAKNLEWMQGAMAGVDRYVAPGVLPEQVILTNSAGAYGLAVSEHMVAASFALIRRFPQYMRNQAAHSWKAMGNIISIEGSTVIVLGLGDIGGRYARKMKALGAYVIGFRRTHKEKPDYVDEQYTLDQLPEVIGRGDIVAMVLPGSKSTEKLMDKEMLCRMKKGSYLINNGRGNAVDLEALKVALDEGQIAGAALDVTDPEPLPADDSLWDYEDLLLTPHVSGNFYLRQTLLNVIDIAGENLRRYSCGEPLTHVVDREAGY